MESRILTRTGAYIIKCGGLAVKYLRESSKIIGMAKEIGHFLLSLNKIYVFSEVHIVKGNYLRISSIKTPCYNVSDSIPALLNMA